MMNDSKVTRDYLHISELLNHKVEGEAIQAGHRGVSTAVGNRVIKVPHHKFFGRRRRFRNKPVYPAKLKSRLMEKYQAMNTELRFSRRRLPRFLHWRRGRYVASVREVFGTEMYEFSVFKGYILLHDQGSRRVNTQVERDAYIAYLAHMEVLRARK